MNSISQSVDHRLFLKFVCPLVFGVFFLFLFELYRTPTVTKKKIKRDNSLHIKKKKDKKEKVGGSRQALIQPDT